MTKTSFIILAFMVFVPGLLNASGQFHIGSHYNKRSMRFSIENDSVRDRDSHFTSGWSIQYHSRVFADWDESETFALIKWIGNHIPALNDDDSVVRTSFGIGQTAYTPADLSNRNPPEYELPYAGSLTGSLSWQSFNQTSARMFQVTVGILGEESLSGQLQIYSHNELDMGEDPRGWDSQRETEPLVNIAYQLNHSLIKSKNLTDRWAGQLSLSSRLSLGNLTTDATTGLSLRYGWNILEGFTVTSEPTGTGLLHLPTSPSRRQHLRTVSNLSSGNGDGITLFVFYDGSLISGDQRDVKRDNIILSGLIVSTIITATAFYPRPLPVKQSFTETEPSSSDVG